MARTSEPQDVALLCGLGNPGERYAYTRHNAGFATIDALAERLNCRYWKSEAGCLVAEVTLAGREILLAKPQDFMNTSGGPLSKLMRARRISAQEIVVIHDEVDLAQGKVQLKFGGGLNAHNGLRSIAAKLNTQDFARIRLGIGRPPGKMSVADYALKTLKGQQLDEFELLAQDAADLCERCVSSGVKALL